MQDNNERQFTEQELVRRKKYQELVDMGKDPFIENQYQRNYKIVDLFAEFDKFSKDELKNHEGKVIKVAGRIRLFREAGKKAIFGNIQDQDGLIQFYARQDELGEEDFPLFRNLDLGDIIGIEGSIMKTDHGELTIRVKKYVLLTKALKPLPDKHSGISDIEEKYRRRYVDLIMNPETKKTFISRNKTIRTIQNTLDKKGYIEVETPILHPQSGGAAAKPFKTFYNALENDFYLRIATELHLKRCIVGGFEGVYEIGRLFRNEGTSTRHNPEFTSIEIYVAYQNMEFVMELCEEIFKECALSVLGKTNLSYGGFDIDLGKPFKR